MGHAGDPSAPEAPRCPGSGLLVGLALIGCRHLLIGRLDLLGSLLSLVCLLGLVLLEDLLLHRHDRADEHDPDGDAHEIGRDVRDGSLGQLHVRMLGGRVGGPRLGLGHLRGEVPRIAVVLHEPSHNPVDHRARVNMPVV